MYPQPSRSPPRAVFGFKAAEVKRVPGRRSAAVGSTGVGDTPVASVAGAEVRGGVRDDVRFPGGRSQSGRERRTGRTTQRRVCERMISNESPVREIRTLGSMSGEGKRSRSGVPRHRWDGVGRRNPCPFYLSTGAPLLDSTATWLV